MASRSNLDSSYLSGVATPIRPGAQSTPLGALAMSTLALQGSLPLVNTPEGARGVIKPDEFMDQFDKLITTELHELGIEDTAMLRAIDKLIKLNNAILDSYFDSKFKELKSNLESQIGETTARFIHALTEKDKVIEKLTSQVNALQDSHDRLEAKLSSSVEKFSAFDSRLDDLDMYERRDTLVLSGEALPPESEHEDAVMSVVNTAFHKLRINLQPSDIDVAHRLGRRREGHQRPIICKFVRRTTKSLVVHKCVTLKPQLYVNEHLTPARQQIYKKLLRLKKDTKLITQLHTKNGKFFLRLKNITERFSFTDENSLLGILDLHQPYLRKCYIEESS